MIQFLIGVVAAAVLFVLIVGAVYGAIVLGVLGSTVGMGLLGFYLVKTKQPIINPSDLLPVRIICSTLWAGAITLALFFGSGLLNELLGQPSSQRFAFYGSMTNDALKFAIGTGLTIFGVARIAPLASSRRNRAFGSAGACLVGSVLFSLSAVPWNLAPSGWLAAGMKALLDTLVFPITLIVNMLKTDAWQVIAAAYNWVLSTGGNLFAVASVLSKIMWLLTIFYTIRGLSGKRTNDEFLSNIENGARNYRTHWSGLTVAILLFFLTFAALIYVIMAAKLNWPEDSMLWATVIVLPLSYLLLMFSLWRIRKRTLIGSRSILVSIPRQSRGL